MSTARRQEARDGFLFIAPWVVGALAFVVGPVVACVYLAFTQWNLFTPPRGVGLANFQKLGNDVLFWTSLENTAWFTVLGVPLGLALALALALMVDRKLPGRNLFRTALFLPNVVTGIATLLVWRWLFDPNFGMINQMLEGLGVVWVLERLGGGRPQWLASPESALPALILMGLWGVGGSMMIFLAGLQGIPTELHEAAECDGATGATRFWRVTLPLLTPTVFFLLVVGVIGSLQTFNQAYVMTAGGPAYSTLFYALYLFQNAFEQFKMGYACAMALLLFLVTFGISFVQVRLSKRWVHYQ